MQKIECFLLLLQLMKRTPVSFAMQYEQCNSDAEDEEMDL